VQGGEKWGRYSIIGLPCRTLLRVNGYRVDILVDGEVTESHDVDDPLAFVEAFQHRFRVSPQPDLPVFHGGLVGYFGYDSVRYVEPKLKGGAPPDELGNPDILLMLSEEVLVFDNLSGTIRIIVNVDPALPGALEQARVRLRTLADRLREPMPPLPEVALHGADSDALESSASSHFTEAQFAEAVNRIKDYVLAGDVMQVVPSQRMMVPFEAPPLNLYRALRNLNPSPYMYFLDLGDFHIVGSSPEILARLQQGEVTVRPLAGTRRRGRTEAEDQALEAELLADPKEIAEHLMLIDLGRNDAGRVSRTGTVRVTDTMVIERYSHVMHIVSNVEGRLLPGLSSLYVLRATFPAGTLTGAPKVHAMELIDQFEPVKRGIYGGACGYISYAGDMDVAIAIRTAVIKDQTLYVQAAAGVVADSVPEMEWRETEHKARALLRASELVEEGLE
jgi:anthranilate synthase component 1